ncbi:DegT/DnrJ/EryC1/StrS family aminotransferase [Pseudomonas sp. UMAB-08]|uniref:DegT/DnrJ/EryC1/StrS family aminotransferase n=1 Tax=Pseudomonas sp. UMAB-08 TaxID=1365375 RepID=UPI001C56D2EB|nr:DegT/DnrJ/EryC1/StrS family aminotransferase [Pseudomonas sp. UMAB-08]
MSIGLSAPVAGVVSILAGMGIQTRRWYCPSLQHHPAFARCMTCGPDGDELPVTAYLSEQTVGVPWFAGITPAQCERVVFALQQALGDFE